MVLFKINFAFTYVLRSKLFFFPQNDHSPYHACAAPRLPCNATNLNVQCDSITRGNVILGSDKKIKFCGYPGVTVLFVWELKYWLW